VGYHQHATAAENSFSSSASKEAAMNKDVAIVFIAVGLWVGTIPAPVSAAEEKSDKEKSYYGTVIAIDRNANTVKLITNDGVVVDVAAEDKAAKH
jgi:hypothetical protein